MEERELTDGGVCGPWWTNYVGPLNLLVWALTS